MGMYSSIVDYFNGNNDDYDDELLPEEPRNIGELGKEPNFDVIKLYEDTAFVKAIQDTFNTPAFLVKLVSNETGKFIEFPVGNIVGKSNNDDSSFIRIYRNDIIFVTMRTESKTTKDDTVSETKKKIEELKYDFKGLRADTYPQEVDNATLSLFVPYAKIAYFVDTLINEGILETSPIRVLPNPGYGTFDFSKENK